MVAQFSYWTHERTCPHENALINTGAFGTGGRINGTAVSHTFILYKKREFITCTMVQGGTVPRYHISPVVFNESKVHFKTLCTIYPTNIDFPFLDAEENLNL